MKDELGDVLFSIVNIARFLDIDATEALEGTIKKFDKRFRYVEQNCDIEKTSSWKFRKTLAKCKKSHWLIEKCSIYSIKRSRYETR